MDPPTAEQLVSAAKDGDLELVQHLLQQGLSVHTTHGNWQDTILHTAAEAGQLRVVEYLVEAGADLEAKQLCGRIALHSAAAKGHVDVAAFLMACGSSPFATDRDGCTPLYWAGENGSVDMIRLLLRAGADVNVASTGGTGPLHGASFWGHHQAASLLLASGAAVDGVGDDGCTPLHAALYIGGREEIVELLLAAGASVHARDEYGQTPLLAACRADYGPNIQTLLQHGAQPDARDAQGRTALHIASYNGNAAAVSCLLEVPEVRALLHAVDNDGSTALSLAFAADSDASTDDDNVIELLLAAGIDVHQRVNGMTLLHTALQMRTIRGVEALLAAGADPNALVGPGAVSSSGISLEGLSPLQLAAKELDSAVPLLATPINLRRLLQGQPLERAQGQQEQQQEQQEQQQRAGGSMTSADIVSLIAISLSSLLDSDGPSTIPWDTAGRVQLVAGCFPAVMEVLGAAAADDLLQQVLEWHEDYPPEVPALLLQAVHSGWLGAMPWLQHMWQVTDQLQQLVIQPLQEQQQQQQQQLLLLQLGVEEVTLDSTAAAGKQALQPPAGQHQPSDLRLHLCAEAEAAAGAGDWRLVVRRLQRLAELRLCASSHLAEFAEWQGRGFEGVAGLCKALLASWCELQQQQQQQQPASKVTPELRDAVVTAVRAWQQQGTEQGGSDDGE